MEPDHVRHIGEALVQLAVQDESAIADPNTWHSILRPVGVLANPPCPVSRRVAGRACPTSNSAPITSSHGILLSIPARAMSAATMACAAPMALLIDAGDLHEPRDGITDQP